MRIEEDSLGTVEVPEERLYGAQTQRSLNNFKIGAHKMPKEIIKALLAIKRIAAEVNCELGLLDEEKKGLLIQAIDSLTEEDIDNEFPLSVWQTGSGTQTNMNVNEVVANRANELFGEKRGSKFPIHPNDHVNKSQSSNDIFPTAMSVAFANSIKNNLLPALKNLHQALLNKVHSFHNIIKIGRTHLMDAVPLRLGDEFSGYASQIELTIESISSLLPKLCKLAIGGTAVGTGINCPKNFKENVCALLTDTYSLPFMPADNMFEALACHDTAVELSGLLKRIACAFFKIANDIRLLASGPRCGLAEIILPENEPGSSIMPGKVNPTQCEAMTMVACQVMGNDTTITIADSQGQFELNVFKPVIAKNCLESISLLADVANSFVDRCVIHIIANEKKISYYLEQSLMLVTALTKDIGYDKAAKIALLASQENLTLREAALQLGVSEEVFNKAMDIEKMV